MSTYFLRDNKDCIFTQMSCEFNPQRRSHYQSWNSLSEWYCQLHRLGTGIVWIIYLCIDRVIFSISDISETPLYKWLWDKPRLGGKCASEKNSCWFYCWLVPVEKQWTKRWLWVISTYFLRNNEVSPLLHGKQLTMLTANDQVKPSSQT